MLKSFLTNLTINPIKMAQKRKTSKKVTSYVSDNQLETEKRIQPKIDKQKAKNLRIFAVLSWVAAIAFEVLAILALQKDPINITWLIVFIVADLLFVIIGSVLWKKANRLDPASEKDRFKFFLQNQLGVIISIIAFLPLVILIFKNKNLDPKQKKIIGGIAVLALLIASVVGIDFNPPSIEQYQEETERVKALNNGLDYVYWTKSGKSYHLFEDCSYINTDRTVEIFEGSVVQAKEMKKISDLCDRCQRRSERQNALETEISIEN